MQQTVSALNAERADDHVDRLVNGDPAGSQASVVVGGLHRQAICKHRCDQVTPQAPFDAGCVRLVASTL